MDKMNKFFSLAIIFSIILCYELNVMASTSVTSKVNQECHCYYLLYVPICASDGKTYPSPCMLECAQRKNPYLLGVCRGECLCCQEPYHNEPIPLSFPQTGATTWGRDNSTLEDYNDDNDKLPLITTKELEKWGRHQVVTGMVIKS